MAQVNPQRHPTAFAITDQGGFTSADVFQLANLDGLAVAIVDGSGNQITSFGGASGSNPAASNTGSLVPPEADYLGINIGGTLIGVTGFSLVNSKAVAVAIVDANGDQITTFGGGGGAGIQFADNAASGVTPTGTLVMAWDSALSKVRALKVDASQNLEVVVQNFPATQPVSGSVAVSNFPATVDVSDRSGRLVGHVTVDNFPATQPVSGSVSVSNFPATVDVSDRAVRLLGVVYGSGAQLQQTAINNNLQVELAVGATLIDPRSIRVLTSADVVDISDRSARLLGHVNVDNFPATQPISGSVSVSNFPATQNTDPLDRAARLLGHVTVDNASLTVNGTVSIGATVATLPSSNPLAVEIVDGSGIQITSFGGGTQYAAGSLSSPITGTAAMAAVQDTPSSFIDGAVQPLSVTLDGRLRVASVAADVDRVWIHTFEIPWTGESWVPENYFYE